VITGSFEAFLQADTLVIDAYNATSALTPAGDLCRSLWLSSSRHA